MGCFAEASRWLRLAHRKGLIGVGFVVLILAAVAVFVVQRNPLSCTPPADQRALLTAYEAESVLKIAPPNSKFVEKESRAKDCLPSSGIREDAPPPHPAFVSRTYDAAQSMTVRGMFDHYGPPAQAAGWALIDTSQLRNDGGNYIRFCKNVAGTVTRFTVQTWGSNPVKISASVFAPFDAGPACPPPIAAPTAGT
ncbi:hypothetical protein [Micromonospora sp. NPDC049679]|uniref:hypothetical protein n=1 Tax=Micromonospora sp. NPDC049679 TaxID=3155920 RepID=UPI0033D3596D